MLLICCSRCNKSWKIKKDPQRITKIKSYIGKYNWERINYPSEKDEWKIFEKNNVTVVLNVFCKLKTKNYTLLMFQNKTQSVKNKLFFNDSKRRRIVLSCSKKRICIIKRNNVKT